MSAEAPVNRVDPTLKPVVVASIGRRFNVDRQREPSASRGSEGARLLLAFEPLERISITLYSGGEGT
jgi:hypothetical protein